MKGERAMFPREKILLLRYVLISMFRLLFNEQGNILNKIATKTDSKLNRQWTRIVSGNAGWLKKKIDERVDYHFRKSLDTSCDG